MIRNVVACVGALLVGGAGGYLLGARTHSPPAPSAAGLPDVTDASLRETPRNGKQSPSTADYQALKAQLAICMAYHEPPERKDAELAACRSSLEMCRNKPPPNSLSACYEYVDMAPIFDRELGEYDPSPETLERAKNLTVEECVRVWDWAERASRLRSTCLRGDAPPWFKERYVRTEPRPLGKACVKDAVYNARMEREEKRVSEITGLGPASFHLRVGDGGTLYTRGPDGEQIPFSLEDPR
jgi:hypothetical protein